MLLSKWCPNRYHIILSLLYTQGRRQNEYSGALSRNFPNNISIRRMYSQYWWLNKSSVKKSFMGAFTLGYNHDFTLLAVKSDNDAYFMAGAPSASIALPSTALHHTNNLQFLFIPHYTAYYYFSVWNWKIAGILWIKYLFRWSIEKPWSNNLFCYCDGGSCWG